MYSKPRPAIILLEPREKLAGWIYLPIYVLLLPLLLGILLGLAVVFLRLPLDEEAMTIHLNTAYGAVNFFFALIFFRRYLLRSARQLRHFPGRFFIALFAGFAIYYFGTAIMTIITQIIAPGMENINDSTIESMVRVNTLEMLIFTVVLVPLAEETLFRGLIFTTLRPHSRFAAYAVTILAFSAVHVIGYIGSYPWQMLFLSFIQYLPASFALAWALEYSGSIWASIGIHTLANAMAMIGMLLLF